MNKFIFSYVFIVASLALALSACSDSSKAMLNTGAAVFQSNVESLIEEPLNENIKVTFKENIPFDRESLELLASGYSRFFCPVPVPLSVINIVVDYNFFDFLGFVYLLNEEQNTIDRYKFIHNDIVKINSWVSSVISSPKYCVYNDCVVLNNKFIYFFDAHKPEMEINKKFTWYFKDNLGEYLIDTKGTEVFDLSKNETISPGIKIFDIPLNLICALNNKYICYKLSKNDKVNTVAITSNGRIYITKKIEGDIRALHGTNALNVLFFTKDYNIYINSANDLVAYDNQFGLYYEINDDLTETLCSMEVIEYDKNIIALSSRFPVYRDSKTEVEHYPIYFLYLNDKKFTRSHFFHEKPIIMIKSINEYYFLTTDTTNRCVIWGKARKEPLVIFEIPFAKCLHCK